MKKFVKRREEETDLDDISGLKLEYVRTQRALYDVEFINITKVVSKYLNRKPTSRKAPFSREWLLRLHAEMYGEVWKWAGIKRRTDKNIGVRRSDIEVELKKLIEDLKVWEKTGMDPLERAARLHHRLVWIHPFENGNGRWARIAANIYLKKEGHSLVRWPERNLNEAKGLFRKRYIAALRDADQGDYRALIALHQKYSELG